MLEVVADSQRPEILHNPLAQAVRRASSLALRVSVVNRRMDTSKTHGVHRTLFLGLLMLGLLSSLAGCSDDATGPGNVKKVEDIITEKEFLAFASIVESL